MSTWAYVSRSGETSHGVAVPLADVDGPFAPGDVINVREPATGNIGGALVTAIEDDTVYLSLAWDTMWSPASHEDIARMVAQTHLGVE